MSKTLSVLIVEDSETIRSELAQIYSQMGFDVYEAENGRSAWMILQDLKSKKKLPDLISSDINMPEMDGVQLLNKVRSDRGIGQLPFVIFTASKDELLKVTAMCLNVNGYQLKPVDPQLLIKELSRLFPGKNFT